jgi:spore coat protein U-like protein
MAIGMVAVAGNGSATSSTPLPFNVTATIAGGCSVDSATNLVFGAYTPAADTDGTSAVTCNCIVGTKYSAYVNGTRTAHSSSTGSDLSFQLYSDSGRSTAFPTVAGALAIGSSGVFPVTVYGRMPLNQTSIRFVGQSADWT